MSKHFLEIEAQAISFSFIAMEVRWNKKEQEPHFSLVIYNILKAEI